MRRQAVVGRLAWLSLAGGFVTCPACEERPTSTPPATAKAGGSLGLGAAGGNPPEATDGAAGANQEGAALAFVQRWAAAQNELRFDDYSALYSARFNGVKRAASRVTRLKREAWLLDRKGMFRSGLRVSAESPEAHSMGRFVTVRFQQRFATEHFSDFGTKEMLLEATPGGFEIVREELLDSLVTSDQRQGPSLWLVNQGAVHLRQRVPAAAIAGAAQLLSRDPHFVVERPVDVGKLTDQQREWLDRPLTLAMSDGGSCRSKVTHLVARLESVPHFGMIQTWNAADTAPVPSARIASEIWALDGESHVELVGVLAPGCDGAVLAFAAETAPSLARARSVDKAAAVTAVQHPGLARSFERWRTQTRALAPEDPTPAKHGVAFELGGRSSLVVSESVEVECGSRRGITAWVEAAQVGSTGPGRTLVVATDDEPITPDFAADLDRDGIPEFLVLAGSGLASPAWWSPHGSAYQSTPLYPLAVWDCPC